MPNYKRSPGVDTDHEKDFTSFALRILNSIEEIEPKILIANLITTLTSCFYSTHPQMLPIGQNRRKHYRSVFLTIWYCILSAELAKTPSFKL